MRLSQTPADISDHQRRVSDSRRLNLGVGAAWMSESLEPRSAPGNNRWGFGAPVTQSYAVGQPQTYEQRRAWLEEQHAKRDAGPTTSTDKLNQVVKEWRAGRIKDTEALIQRIRTKLGLKDRNAALKYYTQLTSKGLLGPQGKWVPVTVPTATPRYALDTRKKPPSDALNQVIKEWRAGLIKDTETLIQRIRTKLGLKDRNAALKYYTQLTSKGLLGSKGKALTASQQRALERQAELEDRLAEFRKDQAATPRLTASQQRALERQAEKEDRLAAFRQEQNEKKGSRNGIPSAAGDPFDEEEDYFYTRYSRPPVQPATRIIPTTPTTPTTPKPSALDQRTQAMLAGLVIYWSQGKYKDSNALIADIRQRLGVNQTEAVRWYKTIQYKLITNPYRAPAQPGQPVQPRQPQTALPAAKTSGGRTTVKKRRTGEADRPHEARILARWNVQNQGDLTAQSSLRLRMGARRILATSMPVEVIGGTRKGLILQWSIPIDMVLGRHDLSLDIFQSHRADGVKHDKVVATHGVTIDVVEPSGKSAAGNQQEQRESDREEMYV